MSPTLFAAVVAMAIVLGMSALLLVAYWVWTAQGQRRVQQRLTPAGGPSDEFAAQQTRPLLASMARGGRKMESLVDSEGESGRLLVQAGWRTSESRLLWYAFQLVLPLVLAGGVLAYGLFGPPEHRALLTVLLGFAAAILAFLAPRWVLRAIAGGRRQRIKREVPLFIHLLALLFDAGLSTRQAFASIVREGRGVLPELGREFEILLRQLEAGGDTSETLKNLGDTLAVEDLTTVLAVLRQVDRYGGEIRQPLLEILSVLEERRTLDARERVNLISGRMTVVMVLFFFPALMIFIAGPAFSSIIRALHEAAAP
jgi:tight adherence protein C